MKKNFILLLVSAFAVSSVYTVKAQSIVLGVQSGYSFGNSAVAGINVGVNFKYFNIRTGFDMHAFGNSQEGMLVQTRIGHTFDLGRVYISPGIGHGFQYKDADHKNLNQSSLLLNCEAGYKIDFGGAPIAIYSGYTNSGKLKILAVGIHGYF